MQRREALVVGLAHVGAVVDELADDGVLSVEARHVQRRVPERVGLVYLRATFVLDGKQKIGIVQNKPRVFSEMPFGEVVCMDIIEVKQKCFSF